ncbi:conserved hypothetical protein [Ureaplasma urealyticum serovar 4 str. ATCC 27816]|nr:conserved hypothetical protein [Ureaplasma urealyticum serovar 4 str. ATCC 27816]
MAASTRPKQESETIETIDVDMTTMVGAKTPYANIYYLGS